MKGAATTTTAVKYVVFLDFKIQLRLCVFIHLFEMFSLEESINCIRTKNHNVFGVSQTKNALQC